MNTTNKFDTSKDELKVNINDVPYSKSIIVGCKNFRIGAETNYCPLKKTFVEFTRVLLNNMGNDKIIKILDDTMFIKLQKENLKLLELTFDKPKKIVSNMQKIANATCEQCSLLHRIKVK